MERQRGEAGDLRGDFRVPAANYAPDFVKVLANGLIPARRQTLGAQQVTIDWR
jgi:hypothetical protein